MPAPEEQDTQKTQNIRSCPPALDDAVAIRKGLAEFKQQLGTDFNFFCRAGGRYEAFAKIETEVRGEEGPTIKVKIDDNIIELDGQPQKGPAEALAGAKAQVEGMLGNNKAAAPKTTRAHRT